MPPEMSAGSLVGTDRLGYLRDERQIIKPVSVFRTAPMF